MSVKRLRLAHNIGLAHDIAAIATELEKVESTILSVSASINRGPTPYLKKELLDNLDILISQRFDLIADLNDAIDMYNEYNE